MRLCRDAGNRFDFAAGVSGGWGLRAPLILTLALDPALSRRLNAARERHFPAERNFIPAHLTLFHALPGERAGRILTDLRTETLRHPAGTATVTGLMNFGQGFAYRLDVPGLAAFHRRLQTLWRPWLTRQDARALRPHVTVQNKVDRDTARATLAAFRARFAPFGGTATGVTLWHYRGGPWEHIASLDFA